MLRIYRQLALKQLFQRVSEDFMHKDVAPAINNTHSFSAIVLAGGRSSRMGQDKALLQLHGKTMLQRTCELAMAAGCNEVLISRNAAGYIQDEIANRGPLAGIAAALKQANNGFCLVLPVDMPALQPADIQPLLTGGSCFFTGFTLPCVLPNTLQLRDYLALVLKDLSRQGRALSVDQLLQFVQAQRLRTEKPSHFTNTNDIAAWQHASEHFSKTAAQEPQVLHE
jgi:molybdopterin-guanine dinucleotide biosynthesis protein A